LSPDTRIRIKEEEKQAAVLWQQLAGKQLVSTQSKPLRIIYPGRNNRDEGPDFCDAVIATESGLMKGDIEVHVKSSGWYTHNHHADPKYNNVILHVVLWHDSCEATVLQNGTSIPILCLSKALRYQLHLLPHHLPCFETSENTREQTLASLLAAEGRERFKEKAARFQVRLEQQEAGEVLLQGVMRALGYSKNTKPFEELAQRLPLNYLECRPSLPVKQALLLGAAGLLPFQRCQGKRGEDEKTQELEQIWYEEGGGIKSMNESDWNLVHIYPHNSPVRRLIALSHLVQRYNREGFLAGMLQLVRTARPPRGHHTIENGLIVVDEGYWRYHLDLDVLSRSPALLGNSKAAEIAVNVILPFAHAWGTLKGDITLVKNAEELYHTYPKLRENCLTGHMIKQLRLKSPSWLTACYQQGLIHIFKNYCREGKCQQCPLSRIPSASL